ncbi:HD domain-containing protein [Bacillus cereus]|uniref:HD domain-containing protein n=1 Tax=Bacillus cereus TaxID=1396 RepID=UPI003D163D91
MVRVEEMQKMDKESINGVVWIHGYKQMPKKNKTGFYGMGDCYVKGGEKVAYKVWDDKLMNMMEQAVSKVGNSFFIEFKAEGNVFNGQFSLSITEIKFPVQENYNEADFMTVNLNAGALSNKVNTLLGKRVSPNGLKIVGKVMNKEVANRFATEFAGMHMHDAEPVGLLHHTTKMMEILDLVMVQHKNFGLDSNGVDLMYVGVFLHDIGKILELKNGLYTNISIATHRFLGAEMIFAYKDFIEELYDELFYYNLISIITQHHGQFEERPRTLYSYVIHLIDNLEAQMTIVDEKWQEAKNGTEIYVNDFRLTVQKPQ